VIIDPLYAISGFGVGALVGITGVGGGSLMTPVLVLLFGIHPVTAVGTDLLYAATTKTFGTAVHGASGTVAWRVVALLAAGSLPATIATLAFLVRLGAPSDSVSHLISVVLGLVLLLTAVSLIFRRKVMEWAQGRSHQPTPRTAALLTVVTGLVLGVLVSISSVGAGAIGVTVLIMLYPTLPTARIVGTDIAHAVPLTLVAGVGHWLIGSVDWPLFLSLIAGSIPGVVLGSLIASRVSERVIRPALAAVLLIVGSRLLV
jgi:uncharacterized membrane protein YfcA